MTTTEERMMIMGLCLQGILANPNLTRERPFKDMSPQSTAFLAAEIENNVKLAHRYADKLCPSPEVAQQAADLVNITRVAHAALIAAGYADDNDEDQSFVFQTVRIFYEDRDRQPVTKEDKIMKAIVDASRPPAEEPEPELFETAARTWDSNPPPVV